MEQKVIFPISFKLVLIFSTLVILVLGVTTYMVSTLDRNDERIKAEEINHTINGRTAETVESIFFFVKNNAAGFLNTLSLLDTSENETVTDKLFADYCARNRETVFLYGPGFKTRCNPAFEKLHVNAIDIIQSWLDDNETLQQRTVQDGITEIRNLSFLFKVPLLCVFFPYRTDGKTACSVVAFSADRIGETLSTGSYNTSFLINRDGNLLIHSDYKKTEAGENLNYLPAVQAMKASTIDNSQTVFPDETGEKRFYAFHRITDGMYVVTSVTWRVVFEAIDRSTYRIVLFSCALLFFAILVIRLFSKGITRPIGVLVRASHRIEEGDFLLNIKPDTRDEIGVLTESFVQMGKGLAERERLKSTFSKFTNKTIAERAMNGKLELGGENRTTTVFFSDIRSFTAMSEKLLPQEIVAFLNEYMTRMVSCVNKTGGIVDKYMGDSIMAVWGAPESAGTPAADAWNSVKTALMMRTALYNFNRTRGGEKNPVIRIGCGINTGPVVAGQIGSSDRMEYTVIGDAVNLASRTESLNKPFSTDILITENTWKLVKSHIIAEEMPAVRVKGKDKPVRIFAVVNAVGIKGPRTLKDLRRILNIPLPQLGRINTDEEEKKYTIGS